MRACLPPPPCVMLSPCVSLPALALATPPCWTHVPPTRPQETIRHAARSSRTRSVRRWAPRAAEMREWTGLHGTRSCATRTRPTDSSCEACDGAGASARHSEALRIRARPPPV
ncbi:hypothetical protein B0H15DRAFT_866679 [Mycena belliarum]|uniref:Secreted protein n=1 Tax=Mycena belliarum TaxID=1033014 RepID=A0AAD6XMF8_9AGAR|nr:hypothetical protein B0H15DRAFT_866679 [Mycena belliae]